MKKNLNFKTVFLQTTLIAAILVGTSACENDQKPKDTTVAPAEQNEAAFEKTNVSIDNDAQFLVNAAEINMSEIQLGQLAQRNSTMSSVKELGKMMEKAHTQSLSDLTVLAKKKTIKLPISIDSKSQEAYKTLSLKSGNDFDKSYSEMMVNGHQEAITMFEKASKESSDIDIRNWAAATLPELRTHLNHAINCQKECEKTKQL